MVVLHTLHILLPTGLLTISPPSLEVLGVVVTSTPRAIGIPKDRRYVGIHSGGFKIPLNKSVKSTIAKI